MNARKFQFVLVGTLSLSGWILAQSATNSSQESTTDAPMTQQGGSAPTTTGAGTYELTGTVVGMDSASNHLRIRNGEGTSTDYHVSPGTQIQLESGAADLSQVKTGDTIRFRIDPASHDITSLSVEPRTGMQP